MKKENKRLLLYYVWGAIVGSVTTIVLLIDNKQKVVEK